MKYGEIEGVAKKVSRVVMGADNQATTEHANQMFDDYYGRGGNAFDTSYHYGAKVQTQLGDWIADRGVREEVLIVGKGAHTPFCNPEDMTKQLHESLELMKTDYVDIYLLHRDNPEIPVGEFVDAMNEHRVAGRLHAYGGSNWTTERIDEANAYASSVGAPRFAAVSNQFSLAKMITPVWPGCIAASDTETMSWFVKTQTALLPWSSQARGFFTDLAGRDKLDHPGIVKPWYSEENFERRDRAQELADKLGVELINVALAYVLAQPFPTFPLIGPRKVEETASSLRALEVELTPEDVAWLEKG